MGKTTQESGGGVKLRVLDLFSGIGGFSLGLERTGGFETVAFCEIDPFCQKVLKKHWPDVPIYPDIKTLYYNFSNIGHIDLVCGGFPCQPHSTASRGRRTAECLWGEMWSVIYSLTPSFVLAENVTGSAIKMAEKSLQEMGIYDVSTRRIGAYEAGAPHRRNRWWLSAHADNKSKLSRTVHEKMAVLPSLCSGLWGPENYTRAIRVPDGLPNRVDRFRAVGNAILPQVAFIYGCAIIQEAA